MSIDRKAYDFFRRNAGYIVGENAKCAIAYARAEKAIQDDDSAEYVWDIDEDTDLSWADADTLQAITDGLYDCVWCRLEKEGEIIASLSGIVCDMGSDYVRVVEAELALEAHSHNG